MEAFLSVRLETFLDSCGLNLTLGPVIFLERNNISANPTFSVLICLNHYYPRVLRGTSKEGLAGCYMM